MYNAGNEQIERENSIQYCQEKRILQQNNESALEKDEQFNIQDEKENMPTKKFLGQKRFLKDKSIQDEQRSNIPPHDMNVFPQDKIPEEGQRENNSERNRNENIELQSSSDEEKNEFEEDNDFKKTLERKKQIAEDDRKREKNICRY